MSNTTFVATTAEGTTVARTSGTKDYNFVILAKNSIDPRNAKDDDSVEGAWSWSADRTNAEKAANTARKVYTSVRVVEVESKLTGKDAKLVLDAIKAAPVAQPVDAEFARELAMGEADAAKDAIASATSLVDLEAALTNAVKVATPKPAAKAAKTAAKAPAPAKVAKEVPVKVAKPTVDTTGLADLVTLVRNLEQDLAAALGKRNAEMASLYATGNVSFAKLADVVGVSPMAARAMVGRA